MFPTLTLPTGKPLFSRQEIHVTRRTTCKSSSVQAFPETARRPLSLYEVLRVEHTASLTEIKTAYRSLAKMYHPDALNRSESESDGRDFIEIHNAYETLSDPAARAVYDLSLAAHQRRASFGDSAVSRVGFYTTRSWETDQCW